LFSVSLAQEIERMFVWPPAANNWRHRQLPDREIRQADTAAFIGMMDQVSRIALRDLPPRESSGP
jgi:hypothetical protein